MLETLTYPGFLRLGRRYLRMGLEEMWRDWCKRAFVAALQRYVPEVTSRDLVWGPSGIRAQSVSRDGAMVEDFSIGGSERVLHVRNAPSPAATASLAIGRHLARLAVERFGL
jgi:L-2-hydroxyglutarate oxidase LhgO